MVALVTHVTDTATGVSVEHAFAVSPVRVGRSSLNDLVVNEAYVSQWHAVIHFDTEGIRYVDLGSTNGTTLGADRLTPDAPTPIAETDVLLIGGLQLGLVLQEAMPESYGVGAARVGAQSEAAMAEATLLLQTRPSARGEVAATCPPPQGTRRELDAGGGTGAAGQILRQLRTGTDALKPAYESYREGWRAFSAELERTLGALPTEIHPLFLTAVQDKYPELKGEKAFRETLQAHGVDVLISAREACGPAAEFLQRLGAPPSDTATPADVHRALRRVEEILSVFASAFVELRNGFKVFKTEMAVGTPHATTPLHDAETPQEVMATLLGSTHDPDRRLAELKSTFADIMIHQVALIRALLEGVKSLLAKISPAVLLRKAARAIFELRGFRVTWPIWPLSIIAGWRCYVGRHRQLTEEEQELTSSIFGRDFARSYATVVGARYDGQEPRRREQGEPNAGSERNGKGPMGTRQTKSAVLLALAAVCLGTGPSCAGGRQHPASVCTLALPQDGQGHHGEAPSLHHLSVGFWAQLLLRGVERDCSGELLHWDAGVGGYECPTRGYPRRDAAASSSRPSEPSELLPSRRLGQDDVIVNSVGNDNVIVWLTVKRSPSGEGVGPLALVRLDSGRAYVLAIGMLRAMREGISLRLERVGSTPVLAVTEQLCQFEDGKGCGEDMRLLTLKGGRLLPASLHLSSGDCAPVSRIALARKEVTRLPSGWDRTLTLTVHVDFRGSTATLTEKVIVSDSDPGDISQDPLLFRLAEGVRTLRSDNGRLVLSNTSLCDRVKDAPGSRPTADENSSG